MKRKLKALSQRYQAALRKHVQQGPHADLQPALALGHQAVALGLQTLDLARIHEHALAVLELELSKRNNGLRQRGERFFAEAMTPIEATHAAARQRTIRLSRLEETLGQRTEEVAAAQRSLPRSGVRGRRAKEVFEPSGKPHDHDLKEALELQQRLQQLTHRVLAAQEDERKLISRELKDEIAQTLLGINVRLLSLKQQSRSTTRGLKNEIASTRRLVLRSAKSVRRFARKLGAPHPTSKPWPVATR